VKARFGLRALVFGEFDSLLELLGSLLVQALAHEKIALVLILRCMLQLLLLLRELLLGRIERQVVYVDITGEKVYNNE
jgi:hypothetical protein